MKLTLEEKLENVKLHIKDGVSLYEIQRTRGQNVSSLKYFVALYRKWGEKAFIKNQERRQYSRETKLKAIKEHFENNKSYRQIAIDLMLTEPGIVSDWVAMYKEKGEESIKDTCSREAYKHHDDKVLEKEYKKLLEDLERTKAENEYLKKSFPLVLERSKQLMSRKENCLDNSPTENFFGRMKKEMFYGKEYLYSGMDKLVRAVVKYIEYNVERIVNKFQMSSLAYKIKYCQINQINVKYR